MGIRQPVAFAGSLLVCCIILYFMVCAWRRFPCMNQPYMFLHGAFLMLLLFEVIHALSHAVHLRESRYGRLQMIMVHVITYMYLVCFTVLVVHGMRLDWVSGVLLVSAGVVVALDILFFLCNRPFLWYFMTTMITFFLVCATTMYSMWGQPVIRRKFIIFLIMLVILIGLFLNDVLNCERMRRWRRLPYHGFLEFVSVVVFVALCSLMIDIARTKKKCLIR